MRRHSGAWTGEKKGSNEEWVNPHDPEAEITRMKDGRTGLAYKRSMRWTWTPEPLWP